MKPRTKPLTSIITQLTTGHGAINLPPTLQAIEIRGMPSRGARQGQRMFLNKVLPRIKYHNNHLQIVTEWIKSPERTKKSSRGPTTGETSSEVASKQKLAAPTIHLLFTDSTTRVLPMGDGSGTDITRKLISMIKKPSADVEEQANADITDVQGKPEELASASTEGASHLASSDSDIPTESVSGSTATPTPASPVVT